MPKLFKLLRSQKKRSSFSPSSPRKKNQGIFRSNRKTSSKKVSSLEAPLIEAAITYTLSEDEDSCGITQLSDVDIENQLSTEELHVAVEDNNSDKIVFQEKSEDPPVATEEIADVEAGESVDSETSENEETFTFTSLEIMRNELAHMMQIANKDKEIYQLKQDAEEIKAQHAEIVASKDAEIERIGNALKEVESALSCTQKKLVGEETLHSETIGILMQTQVELHEFKNRSWLQPLTSFFD